MYVDGQVLAKPGYGKNIAAMKKAGARFAKLKPNVSAVSVTSDYNSEYDCNYDSDSTPRKQKSLKTSRSNSSIIEELNHNTKRLGSLYLNDKNEFNEKYFHHQHAHNQKQSKFNYVNQVPATDDLAREDTLTLENQTLNIADSSQLSLEATSKHVSISQQQPSYSITLNSGSSQNSLYQSDVITVDTFTKDMLHKLFNLAHDLKILTLSDKDLTSMLKGKLIALMFYEVSTRTQCSFAAAAQCLGANVIYMDQKHSSSQKGNLFLTV